MGVTSSAWVVCKGDYSPADTVRSPCASNVPAGSHARRNAGASSRSDGRRLITADDIGQQLGEGHGHIVLEAWPDDLQADR
jgi:hypothetical protein